MRSCLTIIFLSVFGASLSAQSAKLPPVLVPEAVSFADAGLPGVEVFKLLPRGTYKDAAGSYKDEGNPLGLRGGGAYYSFSRHSHSYNQVPQIELEDKTLSSGFYGGNYGFFRDLGTAPLSAVSEASDSGQLIVNYVPPKLQSELYPELNRLNDRTARPALAFRHLVPEAGHTYLLRAISFEEADKLVAFQVVGMGNDGSMTIAWKSLRDFRIPVLMYQTEEVLRGKIANIMSDPRFSKVRFEVADETVRLSGETARADLNALLQAVLVTGLKKFNNNITVR